jgi:hypothetical protein
MATVYIGSVTPPERFPRTYDWICATAFHNIGNVALLCRRCEEKRETDKTYNKQIDDAWNRAMRRGARPGLLLKYSHVALAREHDNPPRCQAPRSRLQGVRAESGRSFLLHFFCRRPPSPVTPAEISVVPIGGSREERGRRFRHHVEFVHATVSVCAGDHGNCPLTEIA